jgi:large exoprotein involved in heme utilization and adhesion
VNLVTQGNNFTTQLPNNVNRSDVSLTNESGVSVTGANGGEITINARNIEVSGGSQILGGINEGLGTPTAVAGDIKLDATGNVVISGTNSAIGNNILVNATGKGGNITIDANTISLGDGVQISASIRGVGDAGNVIVKAKDAVTLNNTAAILSTVDAGGVGQGGRIDITAGSLSLDSVSQVLTSVGAANGNQPAGKGNGGNITVKVNGAVDIAGRNGDFISSKISSSNLGSEGATGTIDITAKGVTLNEGLIQAFSNNGQGGDIKINISNFLLLRNNSLIITDSGSSQQNGNGGNITINAPTGFIVTAPNENSDISANAYSGSGGKVTIKTQQNFWISPLSRAELEKLLGTTDPTQLDPFNLPTNNITAISQVNPDLNGQVSITLPEIDPSRGLSPLPNSVTDPTIKSTPTVPPKPSPITPSPTSGAVGFLLPLKIPSTSKKSSLTG